MFVIRETNKPDGQTNMRLPRQLKPVSTSVAARPRCVPPPVAIPNCCAPAVDALRERVERATPEQLAVLASKVGARMEQAGAKAFDIAFLHQLYVLRDLRHCRALAGYLAGKYADKPATAVATLVRLVQILDEILAAKGTC